MLGRAPVATLALRAVKGVGALISDFFGVSVTCLLLRLLVNPEVVEDSRVLAVLGEGFVILFRREAVTKG